MNNCKQYPWNNEPQPNPSLLRDSHQSNYFVRRSSSADCNAWKLLDVQHAAVPWASLKPAIEAKGDIPNKYTLYKVYMGLIIHTISGGPPPFSLWYFKQNPQEIQKIFVDGDLCVGNLSAKVSFWADLLKLNKLCLTKISTILCSRGGVSAAFQQVIFWRLSPFFKGPRYFFHLAVFPPGAVTNEA